ncbi:MAG: hypothetical protein ACE5ER_06270 [Nitrospinaceae bacterium]
MTLKITLRTFGMSHEPGQLKEILEKTRSLQKGETVLFPEYGAYTVAGSRQAFAELSRTAVEKGITIITTLNLPSPELPATRAPSHYNTLHVFSRGGEIYTPQAKITPQSFEMRHLDPKSPEINVAPYSQLNKVTLRQNGRDYRGFFLICSDLYVLQYFDKTQLESDVLLCPANFGNGAEIAAAGLIDAAIKTRIFKQGFLCNTYQEVAAGLTPLTKRMEISFTAGKEILPYRQDEMRRKVKTASAIYPDEQYRNFLSMLPLTKKGTFTVPLSRSSEKGLNVKLGVFEKVVEL